MKNIENYQLKKCIFMDFEDYVSLINNITGGLVIAKYDCDSLWYEDTDEAGKSNTYWNEELERTLSRYFDTTVETIHTNDFGVWIVYE